MNRSRPGLSGSVNAIFEAGQLLGADRTPGVKLARRNADFRAKAELASVGELRRGIMQHDRGIDLVEEFLRRARVFRHDRIGMLRTMAPDMGDRLVHAADYL